jgi:hypothetical protein
MNTDRVAEHMCVAKVPREVGCRRIALEQIVDRLFRERILASLLPAEQVLASIRRAHGEVRTEELSAPRVERVPVRVTALEPGNVHLIAFEIAQLKERRFATTEAVSVHEIEEEQVAGVVFGDRGEEAFGLFNRVVLDGSLLARTAGPSTASPASRCWALPLGMNGDSAGNPGFH